MVAKRGLVPTDLTPDVEVLESEVLPLQYVALSYVYCALKTHHWNRTRTARALQISIRTLRNHIRTMREAGLTVPESEGRYVRQ